jgi:small-conductance mechanosensitive channel
MAGLSTSPAVLFALLLGASVALLFLAGRLDRLLPRGSRIEGAVQRWAGTGQALIVALGLLLAVRLVYGSDLPAWRWLTIGIFAVGLWSVRQALSDWGSGIVLRAEGTLKIGARISVGDSRGRIRRLGLRSAEVEAENGRLLRLPYSALAGSAIEASTDETAARSHTFAVVVDTGADPSELIDRITSAALLSPWSSAEPPPTVRMLERQGGASRFEITVHPVDSAHASRVENAVRASMEA